MKRTYTLAVHKNGKTETVNTRCELPQEARTQACREWTRGTDSIDVMFGGYVHGTVIRKGHGRGAHFVYRTGRGECVLDDNGTSEYQRYVRELLDAYKAGKKKVIKRRMSIEDYDQCSPQSRKKRTCR